MFINRFLVDIFIQLYINRICFLSNIYPGNADHQSSIGRSTFPAPSVPSSRAQMASINGVYKLKETLDLTPPFNDSSFSFFSSSFFICPFPSLRQHPPQICPIAAAI
ncbi:unnamed protein product [Citrullus colocynthis]|uniref:Uncharacterized protein n=1 Tax=Citrullus colocynthis TaxID=252529 RepID=A0ABP0YWS1_9ROSI